MAVDSSQFPCAIKYCALFNHTSVPCDNPEIRTKSEKVFGCVSRSICITNSVPNSGTPREPKSQPSKSSAVMCKASKLANKESTFSSSKRIVFASTPVKSSNIRIMVGSSCPRISSFNKLWSIEW